MTKQLKENEEDKEELLVKTVNAEQDVQDLKRDIELKDVKIESLQSVIKKRGAGPAGSTAATESTASVLLIKKLER